MVEGRERGGSARWLAQGWLAVAVALLAGLFLAGQRLLTALVLGPVITAALLALWLLAPSLADAGVRWMRHALWAGPLAYAATVGGCIGYARRASPVPALLAEGRALVEELERHRAERGSYPPELPEGAGTALSERFGGWEYTLGTDTFHLSVGDYERHEFVVVYDPAWGWVVDR